MAGKIVIFPGFQRHFIRTLVTITQESSEGIDEKSVFLNIFAVIS